MDRAERTDYAGQPTFGGGMTELQKVAEELIRTAEGAAKHAYLDGVAEGRKQAIAEIRKFLRTEAGLATEREFVLRDCDEIEAADPHLGETAEAEKPKENTAPQALDADGNKIEVGMTLINIDKLGSPETIEVTGLDKYDKLQDDETFREAVSLKAKGWWIFFDPLRFRIVPDYNQRQQMQRDIGRTTAALSLKREFELAGNPVKWWTIEQLEKWLSHLESEYARRWGERSAK